MARKNHRDPNRKSPPPTNPPPAPSDAASGAPTPSTPPAPPAAASVGIHRWLFSRTVRHALTMCKHVRKLVDHQRDLLAPRAIEEVEGAIRDLRNAAATAEKEALEKQMESLEKTANKWLKPYPNASLRENVEVLLVALSVAMAIRTFFLQPFKIPTGSMQPTLFGVTSLNLLEHPEIQKPTGLARICEWFQGISYVKVVAENDGYLNEIEPPLRLAIFNIRQTLSIGGQRQKPLWFPPDYGEQPLMSRAGLSTNDFFHKGDVVVNLRVSAGDHLFVDRLSYNFRPPQRGEIVVFETKGIPEERRNNPQPVAPDGTPIADGLMHWIVRSNDFYIKRLVATGGERVQIGEDRHLIIDGKRLDKSTPHFENVYSFDPNEPVRDSHYSGHNPLNYRNLAIIGTNPVQVSPDAYMVMGDNTASSLDSRFWGEFTASSVIGKSFFVYWPLTKRFGWGQR